MSFLVKYTIPASNSKQKKSIVIGESLLKSVPVKAMQNIKKVLAIIFFVAAF